jgi:Tfp pilus assembly protein PilV
MKTIKGNKESGFSYIDVMIALVIMAVGILALASAISASLMMSQGQEQQLNAKQYGSSTMESIMAAKETASRPTDPTPLGWNAVGNVGSNIDPATALPRGIFVNGVQEVRANAGPDEIMGTADDTGAVIFGLSRRIVITDLCDPDRPSAVCPTPGSFPVRNRQVTITINYFSGAIARQEVLTTVLTDYAVN